MKSLLLVTIYSALRAYVGAGLFNRVVGKAMELMAVDMPGAVKMQLVLEFAKAEALNLSGTLVRAIVEVFLLKQRAA